MTQKEHLDTHGKSVASWTAVGILLFAALLIGVGIFFNIDVVTWIGVALVVVGAIAGKALTAAGFGSTPLAAPVSPAADNARH